MHFDALTLACVTAELQGLLCPGRVQQVLLPDEHSIGLEIYAGGQRRYLAISAQPDAGRVALATMKLRRGVEKETPLLLLLRKYVRDAALTAIEQPDPFERVLWLRFQHGQHGATALVVEPIGRLANIVLVKADGVILECLRRTPSGAPARRVLLPGRVYLPPPTQPKLSPLDDGQPDYYERLIRLLADDAPLWKVLSAQMVGISPTLGREIAWRAAGNTAAPAATVSVLAVAQALQELWSPLHSGAWQPGEWRANGAVVGFSVYPAHVTGIFTPTATISEAIEHYFAARTARQPVDGPQVAASDAYAVQRRKVEALLNKARQRIEHQLAALAADEPHPGQATRLRAEAAWLLALHGQIDQNDRVLEVELDEGKLTIELESLSPPIEQAQRMFKQAGKLERAAIFIPQRREQLRRELDFLAQLEHDLRRAVNQPEIAAVHSELERSGLLPLQQGGGKQRQPAAVGQKTASGSPPLLFIAPDGCEILVGRNARENERVTFELARPNDRWLHVRGSPGSHVVIRSAGKEVSEETLRAATQLAAYYSDRRGESGVDVIHTRRKDVARLAGGHTGQVVVQREEVLRAPAQLPEGVTIKR